MSISIYKLTPPKSLDALQDEINKTRAKVYDLKAELDEVRRTPQPIENLRQAAVGYVERLAKDGGPNITVTGDKLDIAFDTFGHAKSPVKVLAWLFPDEMTERIVASIEERQTANGRKPMTVAVILPP